MREQFAEASNLSCLIDMNSEVERLPEPFRMQRSVIFRVTYSTYVEYISGLKSDAQVRLFGNLKLLKRLAEMNNPLLYRYFLKSMAFSILKELHFAESYKLPATIILPASESQGTDFATLVSSYAYVCQTNADVKQKVNSMLENLGYELPQKITDANMDLYKLAIVLFSISDKVSTGAEINIVYNVEH